MEPYATIMLIMVSLGALGIVHMHAVVPDRKSEVEFELTEFVSNSDSGTDTPRSTRSSTSMDNEWELMSSLSSLSSE